MKENDEFDMEKINQRVSVLKDEIIKSLLEDNLSSDVSTAEMVGNMIGVANMFYLEVMATILAIQPMDREQLIFRINKGLEFTKEAVIQRCDQLRKDPVTQKFRDMYENGEK